MAVDLCLYLLADGLYHPTGGAEMTYDHSGLSLLSDLSFTRPWAMWSWFCLTPPVMPEPPFMARWEIVVGVEPGAWEYSPNDVDVPPDCAEFGWRQRAKQSIRESRKATKYYEVNTKGDFQAMLDGTLETKSHKLPPEPFWDLTGLEGRKAAQKMLDGGVE